MVRSKNSKEKDFCSTLFDSSLFSHFPSSPLSCSLLLTFRPSFTSRQSQAFSRFLLSVLRVLFPLTACALCPFLFPPSVSFLPSFPVSVLCFPLFPLLLISSRFVPYTRDEYIRFISHLAISFHYISHYILHITHHTSHITHRTLHIPHHTSHHIAHHTSHITHHTSHITHHTSHITHCTSHITHHTSHITHCTSHVCQLSTHTNKMSRCAIRSRQNRSLRGLQAQAEQRALLRSEVRDSAERVPRNSSRGK
jgi:hypothetical protein